MAKQTILVPGAVLKEQYLDKYGISVSKLSEDIGLSPSAIRQLINGKLKISLEIALKLEKYFEKPVKYWIDMQYAYSLSEMGKDPELQEELRNIPKAQKIPVSKKAAADKAVGRRGSAAKGTKSVAEKKTAGRKPAARKQADAKPGRKPRGSKSQDDFGT
jgi:addiction module HigA family antidote